MQVPSAPQTGKGAKASMSFNDGTAVSALALTKNATYSYSGETYVNRFYTLGTGRMINSRPAADPYVFVNGIIDGIDVTSTVADEVATSAGSILVANVTTSVLADASVAVVRPAAGEARWVAITVNTGTQAVSATAGTDTTTTTGKAGLLDTYGAAAGEKPLIGVDELLICYLGIDSTSGTITSDEVNQDQREWSTISARMLPSSGAFILSEAMPELHTGDLSRVVYFSGKYWESTALAAIGDAQQWSVTPNTSSVSAVTFNGGPSESQIDNWAFTLNQLFTDAKGLAAMYDRQGYAALKLELPSGHYFQFVGSFGGGITADPASFVVQNFTGSIQDRPYWSGQ